jgi:hypothetical protein
MDLQPITGVSSYTMIVIISPVKVMADERVSCPKGCFEVVMPDRGTYPTGREKPTRRPTEDAFTLCPYCLTQMGRER